MALLTVKEAAKRMGLGKTTFRDRVMKDPTFPVVRYPGVRRVLISEEALSHWIAAHSTVKE